MNDDRLKKLFAGVRRASPPAPAEGFELLVMQAVRREPGRQGVTLSDQLIGLFPRLALAAVLVMALCLAGDWLSGGAETSLTDGVAQLSGQWLVPGGDL